MLKWLFNRRRIKTPIVIQMEAVECGAAALSIILAYYGRFVSLEELRVQCGVSRSGVNASNVIEAAKIYGLMGTGYEVPFEGVREIDLPAIIFWNFSHFVVLEGFGPNGMHINDPAFGPRFVTSEEFKKSYSGVALEFKKGKTFVKGGKPFSIWRRLNQKMKPYRGYLIYLLLLEFALIFLGLAVPLFFQVFVDKILPNPGVSWKMPFFVMFSCAAVLTGMLTWTRGRFLNHLAVKVSQQLTSKFLWHVLHLPISFFTQRYGGEIIQRTRLNDDIANTVMGSLLISGINLCLIGFYLAIIATYSIPIALVGLAAGIFNVLLLAYVNRVRVSAYGDFQQKEAKAIGFSIDALSLMETIKINNAESSFFSKITGKYAENINALQRFAKKDAWLSGLSAFSKNFSNTLLIAIGFWYVLEGFFTVGMFIGLQILLNLFLQPFNQLVQFGARLQDLRVDVNRVDDVLENPLDPIFMHQAGESPEKLRGELALKDVTFGYSPLEKPIISNCSLSLGSGEWVALVGSAGSGKSTLARIACQLHLPWSGQVLYEGIPAQSFSLKDLKKYLALVDQTIVLFSGMIRDNLLLWDETVSEEQMLQAAKDACIHEDIVQRVHAYHGKVFEDGINFSQGQRQRLEIARALVHNPSLLILDEATNSLDESTEAQVIANLRKRKLSCFMISHRLSAIRLCDRLIVMEEGRIVQSGTHEELIKTPGAYKNLVGGSTIG